jgi:antitoxin ParD1/3/4
MSTLATMNVSLPVELRDFIEQQVAERGYSSTSEYVRELVRSDRDRQHLRALLLEGADSGPGVPADQALAEVRKRVLGTA